MKLNCRPGDLAVHIRKDSPNYGHLFEVVMPFGDGIWCCRALGASHLRRSRTHGQYTPAAAGTFGLAPDADLRPIRDPGDDATDEMLQRVGKLDAANVEWALGVGA